MPKSAQPQIAAILRTYKVHYPNFAPVFHWLIGNAGLSSKQIAAAFGISDARVRQICRRRPVTRELGPLIGDLDHIERLMVQRPLIVVPAADVRRELGISDEPDFVELTKADLACIHSLADQVEAESAQAIATGKVEDGLMLIRSYIRQLGRPQSAERIRLLGRLRHHSAWLLIHLGRTRSAIDQARRSLALSAVAFHESRRRIDHERMAATGQILSMAYAMRNRPDQSLSMLQMVRAIHDGIGTLPGFEYHRQLGTALLQMCRDEEAALQFQLAATKMRRAGSPESDVLLFGLRQANVLGQPKWSEALEYAGTAKGALSRSVIAYQTNLNWAAVTGVATGDSRIAEDALQLLGPKPQAFYGHQATIRLLLEITPRLNLAEQTLIRWTRFMMYANLYQDE